MAVYLELRKWVLDSAPCGGRACGEQLCRLLHVLHDATAASGVEFELFLHELCLRQNGPADLEPSVGRAPCGGAGRGAISLSSAAPEGHLQDHSGLAKKLQRGHGVDEFLILHRARAESSLCAWWAPRPSPSC